MFGAADLIRLWHRHKPEPEHIVAPGLQLLQVLLLGPEPDDLEDHLDRERQAELCRKITLPRVDEAVQQTGHHPAHARFHLPKALGREYLLHNAAQPRVGFTLGAIYLHGFVPVDALGEQCLRSGAVAAVHYLKAALVAEAAVLEDGDNIVVLTEDPAVVLGPVVGGRFMADLLQVRVQVLKREPNRIEVYWCAHARSPAIINANYHSIIVHRPLQRSTTFEIDA